MVGQVRRQMWGLAMGCTCSFCYTKVPKGEAFVRSVAFRQVTYCRDCWEERNAPVEVPHPRHAKEMAAGAEPV